MVNLIKKYSKILNELNSSSIVNSIIIFGSTIHSKNTLLSDLDIAIIFKSNISFDEKIEILSLGNEELDICDFYTLPLPLQFKIVTFGKVLKKSKEFEKLKIKTRIQWLEFKPRLKRMYQKRGIKSEYL